MVGEGVLPASLDRWGREAMRPASLGRSSVAAAVAVRETPQPRTVFPGCRAPRSAFQTGVRVASLLTAQQSRGGFSGPGFLLKEDDQKCSLKD